MPTVDFVVRRQRRETVVMAVSTASGSMRVIRVLVLLPLMAALMVATLAGVTKPPAALAVNDVKLYFSLANQTSYNTVSKVVNGTITSSWATATPSDNSARARAITSDGTYIYWSAGFKVYRVAVTATTGTAGSDFINVSTFFPDASVQPSIKAMAVDANYIYMVASRQNTNGDTILRANRFTGAEDPTWKYFVSTHTCVGLTVDPSATGGVYVMCGQYGSATTIKLLSKTASSGIPSSVVSPWLGTGNELPLSNDPNGGALLTNDGTYIYWITSDGTVRRAPLQATSPGSSSVVTTRTAYYASNERLVTVSINDGVMYLTGDTVLPAGIGTYKIYSVTPNATTPATPTVYATYSNPLGFALGMVAPMPPAAPPVISTQPAATTVVIGDPVNLSVSASTGDAGTLTYQWKKDGTDISGANQASYSIQSAATGDAGAYTVVVTNTLGFSSAVTTSSAAQLTVNSAPAPTAAPTTIASTTTAPGGATGGTSSGGSPTGGSATVTTVPPSLVPPANQAQFTSSAGSGRAVVNGSEATVVIQQVDIPAADKEPARRSAGEVRQLQDAATQLVSGLNALLPAGATPPVVVANTGTGAVINGLVTNVPVPIENVTVVKVAEQAVLVAGVNSNGTEVAPIGVSNGPEIDAGGQVAAIAYGLTPGEQGEFIVMSSPILLGTFSVRADGTFRQQATLPSGLPVGSHTLVVATPRTVVGFGFTITAVTQLPATGTSNPSTLGNLVLASLVAGLILVVAVRRRHGMVDR